MLTTGDELLEPGDPAQPGGVRNSNAYTIPALARARGRSWWPRRRSGTIPTRPVLRSRDRSIPSAAVICGGVSVGGHDHVKGALASLGVEQVFWRVALKPGKPTWFGVAPQGALVFGLPGNPVSAMVTFLLFVRPAIIGMSGAASREERVPATLDQDSPRRPGVPTPSGVASRRGTTAGMPGRPAIRTRTS